jgi:hypothetical protein
MKDFPHQCAGEGCAICRWTSGELRRLFFDESGRAKFITPPVVLVGLFDGPTDDEVA